VLVIAVLASLYFYRMRQMQEMVEILEFEKEQLTDEYEDLSVQFDGYQQMDIRNDSLQEQLAIEQQRVHDLLEELRITKVTNARRIAELKKELATVRSVMVSYVHQIDSLNRTNERLEKENQTYRRQNRQIQQQNTELQQQNTHLAETVTRAARLEVISFDAVMLNKRDKKTRQFSQIQKMEFLYSVGKNITCEPGMKQVYMRLTRPDGELMLKPSSRSFAYESGTLQASVWQEIEYAGEAVSGAMYWTVEEILQTGTYVADFFIDGQHVGNYTFELKK
jgi:predicted  nucleic acid-binding Zn-ribbon protein